MKKNICDNMLGAMYRERPDCGPFLKRYGAYLADLISCTDYAAVGRIAACLLNAREKGLHIFFIGNGGSAATAAHFAQDLGEVGRKTGTKNFRTISLSDSTPFITALGNDYGYDRVFAGQLDNLFRKGDVLVAISASGNSRNIIEAVKLAKRRMGKTIGLCGFDGGALARLCDLSLTVATDKGEYGPVEDMHLIFNHMITSYLLMKETFSDKKKKRRQ